MTNLPVDVSAKKQPKIVSYGSALYAKMLEDSSEKNGIPIWQGKLIQTCTSLGIPEGYYKKVVDALRTMECVEVITRGRRGSTLTSIALRHPPTQELYATTIVKKGRDGLTPTLSLDSLAGRLEDLSRQIGGLDIPAALKETLDKVDALAHEVALLRTAVDDLQHKQQNQ